METNPLVSVIVPVYNCARFLAKTLDSVFAQTYSPIEVLVIDDGSTDDSGHIAQSYREVRYYYQSNQGVSAARNVGIKAARGEFIAFLDADDLWQSEKLSVQVAYMLQHPDVQVTAPWALHFLEPGTEVPKWFTAEHSLGERELIIPSSIVAHKSVFHQVGVFSTDYAASEDIEWLCRLKDHRTLITVLPEVLTLRRLHGENLSWIMASTAKSYRLKILRESIARKSQRFY
uniref:Glycosyl transferase family 2 n=1 Tax=Cyanothece sp. (strain PCC 7425 / ATCC 29141) TaxID=395961 RepID=B8HTE2_CYAP4